MRQILTREVSVADRVAETPLGHSSKLVDTLLPFHRYMTASSLYSILSLKHEFLSPFLFLSLPAFSLVFSFSFHLSPKVAAFSRESKTYVSLYISSCSFLLTLLFVFLCMQKMILSLCMQKIILSLKLLRNNLEEKKVLHKIIYYNLQSFIIIFLLNISYRMLIIFSAFFFLSCRHLFLFSIRSLLSSLSGNGSSPIQFLLLKTAFVQKLNDCLNVSGLK